MNPDDMTVHGSSSPAHQPNDNANNELVSSSNGETSSSDTTPTTAGADDSNRSTEEMIANYNEADYEKAASFLSYLANVNLDINNSDDNRSTATTTTTTTSPSPSLTAGGDDSLENSSNSSDSDQSFISGDDALEPIERLEKYTGSDIIFHRQVVARSILETLHEVHQKDGEVDRVMEVISRLAADSEPSIRAELMEQIPHVAGFCVNQLADRPLLVPRSILPILQQFLTDSNNQVRKMTHNAFVVMLEQGLIKSEFLESQVCPLLFQLTDFSNLDDYRIEAVMMMSKLVRFLGKESTLKLLIHPFTKLCMDVSFHVRRVCAANFGEFCSVVGQETVESLLLPQFRNLCEDSIWGVRKSCADVFVPVAIVVSNSIRRNILSPLFVDLLNDQSRWVKSAAFQALGPFISTFADPTKTGLYCNESGVVVVEDHHSNDSGYSPGSQCSGEEEEEVAEVEEEELGVDGKEEESGDNLRTFLDEFNHLSVSTGSSQPTAGYKSQPAIGAVDTSTAQNLHVDSANEYDNFLYWRVPIPDLELSEHIGTSESPVKQDDNDGDDLEYVTLPRSSEQVFGRKRFRKKEIRIIDRIESRVVDSSEGDWVCVKKKKSPDKDSGEKLKSFMACAQRTKSIEYLEKRCTTSETERKEVEVKEEKFTSRSPTKKALFPDEFRRTSLDGSLLPSLSEGSSTDSSPSILHPVNSYYNNINKYKKPKQDIVPNDLLEHFLSMTNPMYYQTIDPELTHHCAYSLPAVALTLGRENWPYLRETYEILAAEMQWKVRWTLASSLHQMSLILGSDYTTKDLLPIFLNFMKDLDEVRFGVLQNLASFLKLLEQPQQKGILPKISDFLKMDNNRNWRFRYTLGEQIIQLASLYTPQEVIEYLFPIGMILLVDKVSEVRSVAIRVVSAFLKRIFNAENDVPSEMKLQLIQELINHLANSSKWNERQEYILLCERLVRDFSISIDTFTSEMLDHMLNMANDRVANVRLALARSITRTFWSFAQFRSHLRVQQTLDDLKEDRDSDVRKFAVITAIPEMSEDGNLDD